MFILENHWQFGSARTLSCRNHIISFYAGILFKRPHPSRSKEIFAVILNVMQKMMMGVHQAHPDSDSNNLIETLWKDLGESENAALFFFLELPGFMATPIIFRLSNSTWSWSPDMLHWIVAPEVTVKSGVYAGQEPVGFNIGIIQQLPKLQKKAFTCLVAPNKPDTLFIAKDCLPTLYWNVLRDVVFSSCFPAFVLTRIAPRQSGAGERNDIGLSDPLSGFYECNNSNGSNGHGSSDVDRPAMDGQTKPGGEHGIFANQLLLDSPLFISICRRYR